MQETSLLARVLQQEEKFYHNIPSSREYHYATSLYLFITTIPCSSNLFLKIHLVAMIDMFLGLAIISRLYSF